MATSPAVADTGDPAKRSNASSSVGVGFTTGVGRSVLAYFGQMFAFYIRHPVKLFRPTLDYTFAAKVFDPAIRSGTAPFYKSFTPFVIWSTVRNHGWRFVGNVVVPPFLANMVLGITLYTSYIAAMPVCTGYHDGENMYPPPKFGNIFAAGAIAGGAQSLVSAPLLTLQTHFWSGPMSMQSLWAFTYSTFRQLGLQAIYSPIRSSLVKESLSYGLFFGVFEFVKQQGYYKFLDLYYGGHRPITSSMAILANERKPHWSLSPAFVIVAGTSASLAHSLVSFPLQKIQEARHAVPVPVSYREFLSSPSWKLSLYRPTILQLMRRGGLYRGFARQSVRMIPGSSIALIIFEGVRRRFAAGGEGIWGGEVVVPVIRPKKI